MAETHPTRTLTATCHCTLSTLSFTLPPSSLPLPVHFCHCTICRHTHGTLCTMHAAIPRPNTNFDTMAEYRSSERVRRWFCAGCGAHMLDCAVDDGQEKWYVAAALVDVEEEGWVFGESYWVGGTGDGGVAALLGGIGGEEVRVWREGGGERWSPDVPLATSIGSENDGDKVERKGDGGEGDEELHLRCHCGAVALSIARPPNPAVFDHMEKSAVPKDKSKWLAQHDACDSCRLVSSSAIVSWIFPLRSCVSIYPDPSSGEKAAYPESGVWGKVKSYKSSPNVTRTFCGTCGATVGYMCEKEKDRVDLAAGLVVVEGEGIEGVKGVKGVRAEEWLEWEERVAFEGDARWKGVIEGLKEGIAKRIGG